MSDCVCPRRGAAVAITIPLVALYLHFAKLQRRETLNGETNVPELPICSLLAGIRFVYYLSLVTLSSSSTPLQSHRGRRDEDALLRECKARFTQL